MKFLFFFFIGLPFSGLCQDSVELRNEITYDWRSSNGDEADYEIIRFKIYVVNNSNNDIPDLGVTNRSKHLTFFVNGIESNPVSLYNGIERSDVDHTIIPGDSTYYDVIWTTDEDSGIYENGDVIQIHWQFMDYLSPIVEVNLISKEIRNIK